MLVLLAAAVAAAAALLYFALVVKGRSRSDPPTPGWLPLVGSLPYLADSFEEQLSTEFGSEPVVLLHLGLERLYCLNSHEAVQEALVDQGEKFSARPERVAISMSGSNETGIVMANGQHWRDYRRFALKTLRDLGFGRQGSERIICSELQQMCELLDSSGAAPISTAQLLASAISNVISQLVFGERIGSEQEFERLSQMMKSLIQSDNNRKRNFTLLLHAKYFSAVPLLTPLISAARSKQLAAFKELLDFCQKQADKQRAALQPNAEPSNFIEAHLLHEQQHTGFTDARLTRSIVDLFVAGTDTTSHTLRWAILQLIANPHVEQQLFQEINNVVGTERFVAMRDKPSMPYTIAVLEEVHRCASLAPNAVLHSCTHEAKVCGYTIPAKSVVFYNIYNIHNTPSLFPQPEQFRPERFLDSEGKFSASEWVIPFGVGKRACLGESLARMELFLFFVTLVQRYRFDLDPSDGRSVQQIMTKASASSGLRAPLEHSIVFTRRV